MTIKNTDQATQIYAKVSRSATPHNLPRTPQEDEGFRPLREMDAISYRITQGAACMSVVHVMDAAPLKKKIKKTSYQASLRYATMLVSRLFYFIYQEASIKASSFCLAHVTSL